MASNPQRLVFKRIIQAPPAELFRAFTHPVALRDWLCDAAQVDPRQGGHIYLWWGSGSWAAGQYVAFSPGRKVAWTWHHNREPETSRVQMTLASKDGGTQVTLAHAIGSGRKWAVAAQRARSAWPEALENLQSVLESGIDLRLARLPRMGIFVDEFNADMAARLGVPVTQGVRLAGVAEGTGAQAAGLQRDDVLVSLGGRRLNGFESLGPALQGHTAGERVPVVLYRGGERMTVSMQLSQRPPPEMPPASELIDTVRRNYESLDAEWDRLLDGVTEAEAAHHPGPGQWSVKETMAHFILMERDTQSWFAQMINDRELGEDLEFRPNVDARVGALVELAPTVPALRQELRRAEAETLALLQRLPDTLTARRHVYRRLASWMLEVIPGHFREEHLLLMQAAVASARQQ